LKTIRERGFATDREEFMKGINCIAMPVFDFSNRPVGAVSISVDSDYLADQGKCTGALERELRFTSIEISRSMGGAPDGGRLSMAEL
jgi:DNA-binding IclR family transcriptional regulator